MFDPHRVTSRNRVIQRRAQILQNKLYEHPVGTLTRKDMDEWARILTINQIPAYISPVMVLPIQITHFTWNNVLHSMSDFTYTSTQLSVSGASGSFLIYYTIDSNIIDFQIRIGGSNTSSLTVPANTFYFNDAVTRGDASISFHGQFRGDSTVIDLLQWSEQTTNSAYFVSSFALPSSLYSI